MWLSRLRRVSPAASGEDRCASRDVLVACSLHLSVVGDPIERGMPLLLELDIPIFTSFTDARSYDRR